MGVEPADCVVVEDTPSGITGAVSAGMRSVGYAADSDERALREAGANAILGSMDELPALLGLSAGASADAYREQEATRWAAVVRRV